jgi:uncharacterized protein YvpB
VALGAGIAVVLALVGLRPWSSSTAGPTPAGRRAARMPPATQGSGHGGVATVTTPKPTRTRRVPMSVAPQRQKYHNDCEATALSMLLATAGVNRSQDQLLHRLPRSRPTDPRYEPDGAMVWGDPQRGFVGRVDGGGTAGGYGVYERPILTLARRYVPAENLTGRPLAVLLDRLRHGRAVMAWVGLSAGTARRWVTPQGRTVAADLGEHVLLLVGYQHGAIIVNDPLTGSRQTISPANFAAIWRRLGRRAVSA